MNRKVQYARLQTRLYTPKAGDLGDVFPNGSKTLEGLDMTVDSDGLHLLFTYRGVPSEILIPMSNVVGLELVQEPKLVKKSA